MTVKELLKVFRKLDRIVFLYDGKIEAIDCDASGSFKALRRHYDEIVCKAYAIDENEILIYTE